MQTQVMRFLSMLTLAINKTIFNATQTLVLLPKSSHIKFSET